MILSGRVPRVSVLRAVFCFIDVKTFFTFFILIHVFMFLTFFIFQTFFIFKKRWKSSERQAG